MEVQKIACFNDVVGTSISFSVHGSGGKEYGHTERYDPGEQRTIDLRYSSLEEGDEIWPVISTHLGPSETGTHVQFKRNNAKAGYVVHGIPLVYEIDPPKLIKPEYSLASLYLLLL